MIIGFSLGDELGFPESIGNLEGSKRRALNFKTGLPNRDLDAEKNKVRSSHFS